jgi:nucleotide-binding universal stress UspA family protein
MVRINKILCPVDFFPASKRAADYAIALAKAYESRLILLHVVSPVLPASYEIPIDAADILESMTNSAENEMKKLAARARDKKVSTEVVVRTGDIDSEIRSLAKDRKVDLIVMGSHGRRGFEKWFLGSVTERLLRRVQIPLLTISNAANSTKAPPAIRRILVTTDFSEGTADAIRYAFSIGQEYQAKVTLMHVLNDISADISGRYRDTLIKSIRSELEELVPEEARDWCDISTRVETGLPWTRILDSAKRDKIDLLVMNVHGKSMLDRALLGSTAERVVRGSPAPVLLIPPPTAVGKRKKKAA